MNISIPNVLMGIESGNGWKLISDMLPRKDLGFSGKILFEGGAKRANMRVGLIYACLDICLSRLGLVFAVKIEI